MRPENAPERAEPPYAFELFAHAGEHEAGRVAFHHATTSPTFTRLYDDQRPITRLAVRRATAGETPDLYGWWDYGNPEVSRGAGLSLVHPSRHQLEMCFPYGVDNEAARGRGIVVALVGISQTPYTTTPSQGT